MPAALLLAALAPAFVQDPAREPAAPDALHVAVVLDDSGSMGEPMPGSHQSKMDVAKAALQEVFAALPPDARVGVFNLNGSGAGLGASHELLPIAPHAAAEVAEALENRVQAGGGTPLGERLAEAADALLQERAARRHGDYRLLVITDGEATDGGRLEAAVPRALGAGLTVDVIGVAMREDHALATRVDRYRRADDPEALRAALREALAESTGDGPAAADAGGESDYDLIAPLPEGAAAVALRALSDPAGGGSIAEATAPAGAAPAEPPPVRGPAGPLPANAGGGNGGVGLPGPAELVCCCVPVLGVGAAALLAFKLLTGGGRPRRRRDF